MNSVQHHVTQTNMKNTALVLGFAYLLFWGH